ncbi:hypothetical protein BZG36_01493 [Bifiguratus adelaidae]|uniref:Uncharacterized protein n=1 Tax=Bifiguratus adelaidae TaxID=1938954 RepID=A0A261Y571_9FUNG|nr:hypothetical protein BZG36_01493 [Bifiguratus adelaidae]
MQEFKVNFLEQFRQLNQARLNLPELYDMNAYETAKGLVFYGWLYCQPVSVPPEIWKQAVRQLDQSLIEALITLEDLHNFVDSLVDHFHYITFTKPRFLQQTNGDPNEEIIEDKRHELASHVESLNLGNSY